MSDFEGLEEQQFKLDLEVFEHSGRMEEIIPMRGKALENIAVSKHQA